MTVFLLKQSGSGCLPIPSDSGPSTKDSVVVFDELKKREERHKKLKFQQLG